MTVKELMEKLKGYPPTMVVMTACDDDGGGHIDIRMHIATVGTHPIDVQDAAYFDTPLVPGDKFLVL